MSAISVASVVVEPVLHIYACDEARDNIITAWSAPREATTAHYTLSLDSLVADDLRGAEFRSVRDVLSDPALELVVLAGSHLHCEVRWREKERELEENIVVKVAIGAVRCPVHGPQVDAEYRAQDPAPCGCAWVWEEGMLVALASRKEGEKR